MPYSIKNVHKCVMHVKIIEKGNTTFFIMTTIWSPWSHKVPHKMTVFVEKMEKLDKSH